MNYIVILKGSLQLLDNSKDACGMTISKKFAASL
jgi:hypothetical protein